MATSPPFFETIPEDYVSITRRGPLFLTFRCTSPSAFFPSQRDSHHSPPIYLTLEKPGYLSLLRMYLCQHRLRSDLRPYRPLWIRGLSSLLAFSVPLFRCARPLGFIVPQSICQHMDFSAVIPTEKSSLHHPYSASHFLPRVTFVEPCLFVALYS